MKVMSEFFSDDMTKHAVVSNNNNVPVVQFFENNQLIDTKSFPNNSMCYAEDAAENYVMGILKL